MGKQIRIISRTIAFYFLESIFDERNHTPSGENVWRRCYSVVTVVINSSPTPRPNLGIPSSKPLDRREAISIEFIVALKQDQESFDRKMIYFLSWGQVVSAGDFAFNRNHTVLPMYFPPLGRRQLEQGCTKF